MKLIKSFQKTTIQKDPISVFNTLVGQLDSNFRTIEDAVTVLEVAKPMATAVLVAGAVTVKDSRVTNNSIILVLSQIDGGTPGFLRVQSRVEGTSFVIKSSSATDTSTVGWLIINP